MPVRPVVAVCWLALMTPSGGTLAVVCGPAFYMATARPSYLPRNPTATGASRAAVTRDSMLPAAAQLSMLPHRVLAMLRHRAGVVAAMAVVAVVAHRALRLAHHAQHRRPAGAQEAHDEDGRDDEEDCVEHGGV